jgi:putative acetyltransferase
MITLVIADDQSAVREGLRMRLGLESDMKIVGEARDGQEALEIASHLQPDIVLMDMEMPRMDGLTAMRNLSKLAANSRVIILTIHDDETSRRRARDSGAAAFVSKLAEDEVLLHAIRAVNSSEVLKKGETTLFTIRFEIPEDISVIHQVNELAFGRVNEADLVDRLRREEAVILSLVAVQDEQVVGHILISPVTVQNDDSQWDAVALGPMAVLPRCQKQGVGSALIRAAFEELKKMGHFVVIVLGHPEYYPRLGFVPSRSLNIRWEIDVPDEVFMVAELKVGALNGRTGVVHYHSAFSAV